MSYERIVLRAEDHLIEAGDICRKGHARIVERRIGRQLDRPQALLFVWLVQEPQLSARKPHLPSEQREGFRHKWLRVRQIREVVLQRDERERIRSLRDEHSSRSKLRRDERHQMDEQSWPEVLEDMRCKDAAERLVLELREVGARIAMLDGETLRTAKLDHVSVAIDTYSVDSRLT